MATQDAVPMTPSAALARHLEWLEYALAAARDEEERRRGRLQRATPKNRDKRTIRLAEVSAEVVELAALVDGIKALQAAAARASSNGSRPRGRASGDGARKTTQKASAARATGARKSARATASTVKSPAKAPIAKSPATAPTAKSPAKAPIAKSTAKAPTTKSTARKPAASPKPSTGRRPTPRRSSSN